MSNPTFSELHVENFLSFGPQAEPIKLQALNVLIGPNASGKSNLIDAFETLRSTPTDLADFVRKGGGAAEMTWKGVGNGSMPAKISIVRGETPTNSALRYRLEFTETMQRLEVVDEALEETKPRVQEKPDVYFYYRFQRGCPVINLRQQTGGERTERRLQREDLDPQQSVLSQRRDPDLYPEVTGMALTFARIATFREWSFGRQVMLRQPQRADLPGDVLMPNLSNLGLVLNDLEHSNRWNELNDYLRRFLPRFRHLSTRILANHVQIYLHEDGLQTPVPATRLSDGTIRYIALLAILMRPKQASVICIEEPELGLHPDAVGLTASLLVEASKETQLVVTTHSDALVSALSDHAESVIVADYLPQGTTLSRIDSEKLRYWLEKYRLGEIWRMGELGGNP